MKYFLNNCILNLTGDVFSCHAIDNPSPESEMALLKSYGPDVPVDVMRRLVGAFGELRDLADQGLIQYPYSTREVVNIVKHLQVFYYYICFCYLDYLASVKWMLLLSTIFHKKDHYDN